MIMATSHQIMTRTYEMRDQIIDLSRQKEIGTLEEWFEYRLGLGIEEKDFLAPHDLDLVAASLVNYLVRYRLETGVSTVVLGMSGGVDSALCAALFKKAGWRVIGVTMPIHQVQAETDRGVEACQALGLEHLHVDLSDAYDRMLKEVGDFALILDSAEDTTAVRIRRGNMRARIRMITLYNFASKYGGLVASTDNFSELTAGFWTLHGDVGDLSPIQSLLKSWEVPYIAMISGVPESTYRATPTDGLGISNGDEAQLGCSYLEWDIITLAIAEAVADGAKSFDDVISYIERDAFAANVSFPTTKLGSVADRMNATWFKRMNPINVPHPMANRFGKLEAMDEYLFRPNVVRHG
jgi:NAD+ synthetase